MPHRSPSLKSNPDCCCLCQRTTTSYWNSVLKAPVCRTCNTIFNYGTPNDASVGQPLRRFPSFSLEFEVAANQRVASYDLDRALILVKHHFKRTQDGTVDYEYKSPIFHSICAARKALNVMDTLSDLVSDRCGTHLHIACQHKDLLLQMHGNVFSPLLTHMLQHSEETTRFWGRYFNNYATPVNRDRYHCFNLESKYQTLEFRLPRFRNAEQYLHVIKFARASVGYLDRVIESVFQAQLTQQERPAGHEPTTPSVDAFPSALLGRHVLKLYRSHVARVKNETSWFARLSPQEQLQSQTFASRTSGRRVYVDASDDEDDDDDNYHEDDDDEDWLF